MDYIPKKIILPAKYCRLEPLLESSHGEDLWNEFRHNDEIWDYLFYGPWKDEKEFRQWLKEREIDQNRIYYTIIEPNSNKALGAFCLLDTDLKNASTEIGGIIFSPKLQKTRIATEAVFCLMNYAFDLGFRRLQWKCNNENDASKKAARRFGFKEEGLLRQHMIVKGKNRDSLFFSIIDSQWPELKESFEKWLDEKNFDENGRQKIRLENFRDYG
jgi:RimJ/RimL family protein N-acetyltransferase